MFVAVWFLSSLAATPVSAPITLPEAADTASFDVLPVVEGPAPVVNGKPVPADRWPDAAFVFGNSGQCSGTLIAPKWVLTAAHCVPGMSYVLLNTNSNTMAYGPDSRLGDAERIEVVSEHYQRSNSYNGYDHDIALLELAHPAKLAKPRVIAQDCILDDYLKKGATVEIVGWGATRETGNGYTDVLLQGKTFVQTPDCSASVVKGISSGCNPSINPGGEIGAGGNGVDACFGDSGGPLYLPTPRGSFLIGVTSRSYDGASPSYPCRDGGLYARPDASLAWIEKVMGAPLEHPQCGEPPAPLVDPIHATSSGGRSTVDANDPDGGTHTYEIVDGPAHGTATVDAEGKVEYTPDADYVGADTVTVRVTDNGTPKYPKSPASSATVEIPVDVTACGCSTSSSASSAWSLALVLAMLRRRRA